MPHSSAKLLIVDDLEENLQLLGQLLSSEGYDLTFAMDAATAFDRAKASPPDLILLDIFLPDASGFEVAERFRTDAALLGVPIIFLTSANDPSTVQRAFACGGVDFVSKPFDPEELLARVKTHVLLKRTRDRLFRLVEERNRLMSVLAHDLRNPVSAIKMATHLLAENMVKDAKRRHELNLTIKSSVKMVEQLIETHLENAVQSQRINQLTPKSFSLTPLLRDLVPPFGLRASEKEIELKIDLTEPEKMPQVLADPLALRQIIENFLSNALKFSAARTSVWLTCKCLDSHLAEVAIADEGPGLSEEDLHRLWSPFARLSARPTGGEASTGLGLSIVKELAGRMNCEVGCDNERPTGARFWIRIPIAADSASN
jgi:signal transduction histidine kinase